MGLSYLFRCDICGYEVTAGISWTLCEEDTFVHDGGWEDLPDGWGLRPIAPYGHTGDLGPVELICLSCLDKK